MASFNKLTFVNVKSFGDAVIAATMLERLSSPARKRVSLLAGRHLAPLLSVLPSSPSVRYLNTRMDGPAAFFDVRRLGIWAATRSALSLRQAVNHAVEHDETLAFDALGMRERFLAGRHSVLALPPSKNIYCAYEALFGDWGLQLNEASPSPAGGKLVRIFAGARMAHRQPPAALLHEVVDRVLAHGGRAEVVLLQGERPKLEKEDLPIVILPQDFRAVIDTIQESDVIVSPDSMTAHVAEHCSKPVFVLTPEEKFYWMPRFAAQRGTIAIFDDGISVGSFQMFLEEFVR